MSDGSGCSRWHSQAWLRKNVVQYVASVSDQSLANTFGLGPKAGKGSPSALRLVSSCHNILALRACLSHLVHESVCVRRAWGLAGEGGSD